MINSIILVLEQGFRVHKTLFFFYNIAIYLNVIYEKNNLFKKSDYIYIIREGPKPNHQGCQNQMNRNGIPI